MVWSQQTSSPVTPPLPTPLMLTDGMNIEILASVHSLKNVFLAMLCCILAKF